MRSIRLLVLSALLITQIFAVAAATPAHARSRGREFPDPTGAGYPSGITSGPDGNLWFTESSGKIGRVTPSGVFTEFPIPTVDSYPYHIAAGPDGNLWFTEDLSNNVGRVTPSGVFTEFRIPTPASYPNDIT